MAVDCFILLLSCSISTGALGSPDLLLSYSTINISSAQHRPNILIITPTSYLSTPKPTAQPANTTARFNWMRIRDGERQNMSEPVPLTADQIAYTPAIVNGEVIVDAATAKDDPRAYVVTSEDENCTFKVKCRPVRSDGCRGELFTSKPSKKIV